LNSDSFASIFSRSARSCSSCDRSSTPIAHGANFSFFSRADAIFPFKPDSSTPIAHGANFLFFPEPMQFFLLSQKVLHWSWSARSISSCDRSSTNSCLWSFFSSRVTQVCM
jgi:hypothetical protein